MRIVLQRVKHAAVCADGVVTGSIAQGFLILVGFAPADTEETVRRMLDKVLRLRIFSDENDKINLSLSDVGGTLLVVSQFTLYADCHKGNRPNFIGAAPPKQAAELYQFCLGYCRRQGFETQAGVFGADMQVSLCNDGPFTVVLDSETL